MCGEDMGMPFADNVDDFNFYSAKKRSETGNGKGKGSPINL